MGGGVERGDRPREGNSNCNRGLFYRVNPEPSRLVVVVVWGGVGG